MTINQLLLILSLTSFLCWTDSSPADYSLGFDNLDTDISDLKYDSEGTLDDFFKTVSAAGTKKKTSDKKGLNIKYNIEDLKKFLKLLGLHDAESYDDAGVYAVAKSIAASGVGVAGNEERKYKKGAKSKGFHRISHKDEYNDDKEYYADDEISGVIKKIGAKGLGFESGAGAGLQKGYYHHDHDKALLGKEGFSDKGKLNKEYDGFTDNQGFDAYFKINNK
ncbi:unnamed protein product [Euphydryas editha]|uniref:Uncharacterized protein n=1 Tax=Euphydryas editha TaxID=104508 RepID=A0AAU9U852_EUPED|nr:unnamed protein product [Euphydryas editha]